MSGSELLSTVNIFIQYCKISEITGLAYYYIMILLYSER